MVFDRRALVLLGVLQAATGFHLSVPASSGVRLRAVARAPTAAYRCLIMQAKTCKKDETFGWTWDGTATRCFLTRQGEGLPSRVLLLPGMSSISTRNEMAPLQALLAQQFETVAVDWPGFGTNDKPRIGDSPDANAAWLDHVLREIVQTPTAIVACGHAAGYVLRHFADQQENVPHMALVAPTWRGPLPTMMNGRRPGWLKSVRSAVGNPTVGQTLYNLNMNERVVELMAKGHVYSDPTWLTPTRMDDKRQVTKAEGARFASVQFVTGGLDPFETADEAAAAAAAIPKGRLHLIWGEDTPRKSKAAMAALADASGVRPTVLQRGKLGVHEEFPAEVAAVILSSITPRA